MIKLPHNILIVGLGLIGGSYAKKLKSLGYHVGAVDMNKTTITYALEHGIIDEGSTAIEDLNVKKYHLVIFALYPKVFKEWIMEKQNILASNTLITDVTGVKCCIVDDIQGILRSDLEFVPAHPMAGREVSGVENADATIFEAANYIVTPTSKNTLDNIDKVKYLGKILGFKNIVVLTPEEHDEMIAFLSQLTHCIAVSLMCSKESKHLAEYTGDSFRDLTRIARINENMWSELFIMNKEELVAQMNLFLIEFNQLKEAIETENIYKMKEMMRTSTERRSYFDK